MNIQINIDDGYLVELGSKLGVYNVNSIIELSVAILNWAVEQSEQGRRLGSVDTETDVVNLLDIAQTIKDHRKKNAGW